MRKRINPAISTVGDSLSAKNVFEPIDFTLNCDFSTIKGAFFDDFENSTDIIDVSFPSRFEFEKKIQMGTCSVVSRVVDKETSLTLALKSIHPFSTLQEFESMYAQESYDPFGSRLEPTQLSSTRGPDTIHPSVIKEHTTVMKLGALWKLQESGQPPWIRHYATMMGPTHSNFLYEYLEYPCSKFTRIHYKPKKQAFLLTIWDHENSCFMMKKESRAFSTSIEIQEWLGSVQKMYTCLFSTLEFFHRNGMTHNDVFLNNMLMDAQLPYLITNVKMCDFGANSETYKPLDNPYTKNPLQFYKKDSDLVSALLCMLSLFGIQDGEAFLKTRDFSIWSEWQKVVTHPIFTIMNQLCMKIVIDEESVKPKMAHFWPKKIISGSVPQNVSVWDHGLDSILFTTFPFDLFPKNKNASKFPYSGIDLIYKVFVFLNHFVILGLANINIPILYLVIKKLYSKQSYAEMKNTVEIDCKEMNQQQQYINAIGRWRPDYQTVVSIMMDWIRTCLPHPLYKWPKYEWCEFCQTIGCHANQYWKCLFAILESIGKTLVCITEFLFIYSESFVFVSGPERLEALQYLVLKIMTSEKVISEIQEKATRHITTLDNHDPVFEWVHQKQCTVQPLNSRNSQSEFTRIINDHGSQLSRKKQDFLVSLLKYINEQTESIEKLEPFVLFFTEAVSLIRISK